MNVNPNPRATRARSQRDQKGMILLILLFLAAVMMIGAAVAAERLVTQGRRQKEEELVWRGEQYQRAIRLYYRKYGQFPKSIEDFSKNPGNLHFLRKVYTDPMNSTDGSWRYIYIGPSGQLIGSLTRQLPIGMVPLGTPQPVLSAGGTGQGTSSFGSSFGGGAGAGGFGSSSFGSSGFGSGSTGSAAAANPSAPNTAQANTTGTGATPPAATATAGDSNTAVQTGGGSGTSIAVDTGLMPVYGADSNATTGMPEDFGGVAGIAPGSVQPPKKAIPGARALDGPIFGGQLIGVASKVDRKSILFYKGYGKYREWEFIWDPAQDAAAAGTLPGATGALPVGIGGLAPTAPATGTQPPGNPPPGTPTQPPL